MTRPKLITLVICTAAVIATVTVVLLLRPSTLDERQQADWAEANFELSLSCARTSSGGGEDSEAVYAATEKIVDIAADAGLEVRATSDSKRTVKQALLLLAADYKDCLPESAGQFEAAAAE